MSSITYSTDASNVKTATFTGTGTLSGATADLSGATIAIIEDYSSIGYQAFVFASSLTSITIPTSVTSIGDYAFYYASSLTSITIPAGVTSIGDYAFYYATSLTSVTFAEGSLLTSIGEGAFGYTSALTSITIPEGVTSIGSNVFLQASSLTSITIPASVTSIGNNAFLSSGLTTVYINNEQLSGITSPAENVSFFGKTVTTRSLAESPEVIAAAAAAAAAAAVIADSNFTNVLSILSIDSADMTSVLSIAATNSVGKTHTGTITMPNGNYSALTLSDKSSLIAQIKESYATALSISTDRIVVTLSSGSIVASVEVYESAEAAAAAAAAEAAAAAAVIADTTFLNFLTNRNIDHADMTSVLSIADTNSVGKTHTGTITMPNGNYSALTLSDKSDLIAQIKNAYATALSIDTNLIVVTLSSGSIVANVEVYESAEAAAAAAEAAAAAAVIADTTFLNFLTNRNIDHADMTSVLSIADTNSVGKTHTGTITMPSGDYLTLTSSDKSDLIAQIKESYATALSISTDRIVVTLSSGSIVANVEVYESAEAAAAAVAAAAVIADSNFTNVLSNLNIISTGITSVLNIAATNSVGKTHTGTITMPNGNYSALTLSDKSSLIAQIKNAYATALSIDTNLIVVTLSSGSIVANVEVYESAEAAAAAAAAAAVAATPICFPAGTPVTTDQGIIAIEKLNPSKHTIRRKEIVAITQTRPLHKYIVSIEKDALSANVPSQTTEISKEHKVFYKGTMVKAKDLVEMCEGVNRIPYNGDVLYNVLLKKHDKMMVNNLICETLDPRNIMAKICGGNYNNAEQRKICEELNEIIKTDNVPAYKKLYASLK
jgi:hypothetical protein